MPALRAALAARPGRIVRDALLATGHVALQVGDVEVRLGWADLKFIVQGREGFAAAADRDVIVALDTTMTPDLQRKALARHLVHQIQMMRKEARLNVGRSHPYLGGRSTARSPRRSSSTRAYICAETLAVELRRGLRAPRAG